MPSHNNKHIAILEIILIFLWKMLSPWFTTFRIAYTDTLFDWHTYCMSSSPPAIQVWLVVFMYVCFNFLKYNAELYSQRHFSLNLRLFIYFFIHLIHLISICSPEIKQVYKEVYKLIYDLNYKYARWCLSLWMVLTEKIFRADYVNIKTFIFWIFLTDIAMNETQKYLPLNALISP